MNHLTTNLRRQYAFSVYTSSHDAVDGVREVNGAQIKIVYLKANGVQSVLYDGWSMLHASFKHDTILVLGTSGCMFLPLIKLLGKKIVLNPDGAEWKRGKWSTPIKKFLKFSEYMGVKFADVVITDNLCIQQFVEQQYNVESELIEYGGDNAIDVPLSNSVLAEYSIPTETYAFKVCRIEPENNIDMILEAFSKSEFCLVLVGNWKRSQYGLMTRKKYEKFKNLILLDAIYDQAKLDGLRSNCSVYVHGHSVGGTNPSLVEAMNLGLSCVVFDVDYNRETTENKAIYFANEKELFSQLTKLANNDLARISLGDKMQEIALRRYQWSGIIKKYASTF